LELFSSKGYDATSVREICEAAAVTKPTLYHFYGSKEGVYRALLDGAFEAFRSDLAQRLDGPGTVREKLKRVARGCFAHAASHRQTARFVFTLIHNTASDAPKTDFPRFYEEIVRSIERSVEEGVASGELCPAPSGPRMLVFMGALNECLCASLILGTPELTPELADSVVDTILGGWIP
jgi:AcrR family transcriptional regulator